MTKLLEEFCCRCRPLHQSPKERRKRMRPTQGRAYLFSLSAILMVLGVWKKPSASATKTTATARVTGDVKAAFPASLEARLRSSLWGIFAGDALAMPSHWYYGGAAQVQRDYGVIRGYVQPVKRLPGSILNKSNINGGGRGSFAKTKEGVSIIGDVINHGKREYWDPSQQIHYHATLQAGENTLEAQLARVLMKSIVANNGQFNADHFRQAYIDFMTTPGSHNDTYASTCHRMFFANLVLSRLDPKDCPDNDAHNVDTIDGLLLPTISALAATASARGPDEVADAAAATVGVTRNSPHLEDTARIWSQLVMRAVQVGDDKTNNHSSGVFISQDLVKCWKSLGFPAGPSSQRGDQVTACYLSQSLPSTLDMVAKYTPLGVETGLLANANVGGENVHRGSILGAVLGARTTVPKKLREGLHSYAELEKEIDDFVKAVLK